MLADSSPLEVGRVSAASTFEIEELRLAARNHAGFTELLDRDVTPIGAHYLVVHFDIPTIEPASYRLDVDGRVRQALSLSMQALRERTAITRRVTLECAGNGRSLMSPRLVSQPWITDGVGTAEWTGVPLRELLDEAGLVEGAIEVAFFGRDRGLHGGVEHEYGRSLTIDEATADGVLLAYEMNGQPLPPQHGYPLRLVVPGWYGMASVKWLDRIVALDRPFEGPQQALLYRYTASADDPGEPVTRMNPRSALVPPGIPDGSTRRRHVTAGRVSLAGKAWSGYGPIVAVEVSADRGATWWAAEVEPQTSEFAWQTFRFAWRADVGRYGLASRATDAAGNVQPRTPRWNYQGMGNNVTHIVDVDVHSR